MLSVAKDLRRSFKLNRSRVVLNDDMGGNHEGAWRRMDLSELLRFAQDDRGMVEY
jgi:hypothetical protein